MSYSEVDGAIIVDGMKNVIDHSLILGGIQIDDVISGVSLSITNNWITSTGAAISVEDAFLQPDILGTIGGNVVWKAGGAGMALGLGTDLDGVKISNNLLIDNGGDGVTLGPSLARMAGRRRSRETPRSATRVTDSTSNPPHPTPS